MVGGLVFKGKKVVIPKSLRGEIVGKIHEGHLGIEKCRQRAHEALYWLGMNQDITNIVQTCETCQKFQTTQHAESLMPHEITVRPWQKVDVDLFTLNIKNISNCFRLFQ